MVLSFFRQADRLHGGMLLMLIIGIALGIALVWLWYSQQMHIAMVNPNPHFEAPGAIWRGTLMRFTEASNSLFPDAPARSYVSVGPAVDPRDPATHDTCFYIRSIGKRDGAHRFAAEVRLNGDWRSVAQRAERLMAQIDPGYARLEKSHGQIIFTTGDAGELARLVGAAHVFVTETLDLGEDVPLHVSWHWAGYNGADCA